MSEDKFEKIQVGDEAEVFHTITAEDVATFAKLTGDNNPLHVDDAYAANTTFRKRVVHGMLTTSFISRIIGTKLPGGGSLWYEQKTNFLAPVRIGERIRVWARVKHKSIAQRIVVLETVIFGKGGRRVVEGEAKVKVLQSKTTKRATVKQDQKKAIIDKGANRTVEEQAKVKASQSGNAKQIPTSKGQKGAVIISGASRGIGAAIAKALAGAGFPVVVNYRSSIDEAEGVVAEITAKNGRAVACKADVSDEQAVREMVSLVCSKFKTIFGIVNNASGGVEARDFSDLAWDDIQKHIDIQLKGAFNLTQSVLSYLLSRQQGVIVNITSVVTDNVPPAKWLPYNLAKAALVSFTKTMACELGPKGIRVNCVSPGMTQTDFIVDIPEKMKMLTKMQTPLRRLSVPEDVAEAVAFLFSEKASFITGQNIRVCGGIVMP